MNFNKVILVGRLTRDPESRTMPSGKSVVSFGLATNRVWNDQSRNKKEETEFHNIVVFGRLAEICSTYLKKGQMVLVEGRIRTRSWEDQNNNNIRRYRTEIIINNMQMGPKAGAAGKSAASPEYKKPEEDIPVVEEGDAPQAEEDEVNVKDIPF